MRTHFFPGRRAVCGLAATVMLATCGGDPIAPSFDLAAAQARWTRTRPTNYRYRLSVGCFCPSEAQPVTIEVHGDSVFSRTNANGQPVDPRVASRYRTIDGMFGVIAGAIGSKASTLDVVYDRTFGFPTSISIDYVKDAVDDEIGYVLTGFETF